MESAVSSLKSPPFTNLYLNNSIILYEIIVLMSDDMDEHKILLISL